MGIGIWQLLIIVVGVVILSLIVRRIKGGAPNRRFARKRHSLLAAFLWIISGVAIVWLLAVFYNANVERLQSGDVVVIWIAVVGMVIGLIGYRITRPAVSPEPRSEKAAQPTPEQTPTRARTVHTSPRKTVFVSYRRDDSADVTGRVYDRLSSRFGNEFVFKDVDSIPLGRDFREVINDAVAKASVVIVVVGKNWVGKEQGSAKPRIHDQTDFVRAEVAAALQLDKPVIPVLVSNAKMPSESDLPDDVKAFAYRNGVNVRPDPDFAHDIERLIKGIEQA